MPSQDRLGLHKRTLHRQPRLSSLGRQRESRLATLNADDGEITHSEKAASYSDIPRMLASVHYDVPRRTESSPSEDARVATRLATPTLTPPRSDNWAPSTSAARSHQSLEWETETLLEPNATGSDSMAWYPCPYRKRNPARFNIRDYEDCARAPFDSIRALKEHIIRYHQRRPALHQCRRCKEQFKTEAELEDHVLLPKDRICEVKEPCLDDYEDGITEKTASVLAADHGDDVGSWTWRALWCLLFPDDPEIPDAEFHPVAELAEIEQAFDEGQASLKEELREKLELLLPDPVDPSYLGFLTGQLELVFETHRMNVIKRTLGRCRPNVSGEEPSRTQIAEQLSEPKKPSRRSRRSTMLQALQRGTHSQYGRESLAGGRTIRYDINSHRLSEQSLLWNAENPSIRKPSLHSRSSSLSTTGPRDSRDSGIGLPCETCSLEPCRCSEASSGPDTCTAAAAVVAISTAHDSNQYHHRHQQHNHQQKECQSRQSYYQQHQKHTRGKQHRVSDPRQSRLVVQTEELHPSYTASGGPGDDNDGFSPESFKQRLLRQQLMGV